MAIGAARASRCGGCIISCRISRTSRRRSRRRHRRRCPRRRRRRRSKSIMIVGTYNIIKICRRNYGRNSGFGSR